jgi:hypothetical protein
VEPRKEEEEEEERKKLEWEVALGGTKHRYEDNIKLNNK